MKKGRERGEKGLREGGEGGEGFKNRSFRVF